MLASTVYCVWPVLPGKFGSLSICGYSAQGQCQTTGSRWKQCTKVKPLGEGLQIFWPLLWIWVSPSLVGLMWKSFGNQKLLWQQRQCRKWKGLGVLLVSGSSWQHWTPVLDQDHVLKEAEMWRRSVVNLPNLLPRMSVDSPGKLLPV